MAGVMHLSGDAITSDPGFWSQTWAFLVRPAFMQLCMTSEALGFSLDGGDLC
jgi:hypothetical protein